MVDVVNPLSFPSQHSLGHMPSASSNHSASTSKSSLNLDHDDENDTITAKRMVTRGKECSQEDLRLLAVSAQITEITYSISDIQTRIFEIQELRHQPSVKPKAITKNASSPNSSQNVALESTSVIDQALINLDERLEAAARSVEAVEEGLTPLLRSVKTPTQNQSENVGGADRHILRKHGALLRDWEAVQTEAEVLREELKEDKWLTVFRSVSEQADGMMKSLEKAVTQCQDFIWQVNKARQSEVALPLPGNASVGEPNPINLEVFTSIHNAFESKKKYYMPSVSKILSVVDKGVRDRVTKNGECLRLHAEMRGRWRNLRERINRIDSEMESVRRMLVNRDLDRTETESTYSRGTSKSGNGFLDTPSPPRSRAPSSTSTLSRSISPFRKFAARLTGPGRSTPTPKTARLPSTEPVPSLRERASVFFRSGHKVTQSISESSNGTSNIPRQLDPKRQRWNSSTKVEAEPDLTIKATPPKRPSVGQAFASPPSMLGHRSVTPSSQTSSRPWSPSNSTVSTPSTHVKPTSVSRPSSRATSSFGFPNATNPRPRSRTPSQIPVPALHFRSSSRMSDNDEDTMPTSLMQRALSPPASTISTPPRTPNTPSHAHTPEHTSSMLPKPRASSASVSHIPVPRLSVSRPGSAMSNYSAKSSGIPRAQTPESSIRARAQQMPFYQSASAGRSRQTLPKGPPSSFRDTLATPVSTLRSRPSSRGAFTPSLEQNPVPTYIPGNMKDPLDVEVARVVNSMAHGFLIERVDPPLRAVPKPGEEVKAQYAISNALARKVLNCRLVVISRSGPKGGETRKVMCRVGGGWQDLSMYLLSRAAGGLA
ncbi:hypothetical protein JB92DRAFT_2916096 [Gautieria morchelliformis]|nr:hypothetical protein JB92DRAFT_2916096 [Gautieria morchelliformis]